MLTTTLKLLKKNLTDKFLDIAESLPKFQGGFIYELQSIREQQRRMSDRDYERKIKPDGVAVSLDQVRLVVTFHLEEFQTIRHAILKLFRNNAEIRAFVNNLIENEGHIFASNWRNLGSISEKKNNLYYEPECIDELPEHVRTVRVTYHRIMSSLACLTFSFYVDKEYSDSLNKKQGIRSLPQVNFETINPLRMTHRYLIGDEYTNSNKLVRGHTQALVEDLNKWLESRTKLSISTRYVKSVIEVYSLKGAPTESAELSNWFDKNRLWLSEYGVDLWRRDTFRNDDCIYCSSDYPSKSWPVTIFMSIKRKDKILENISIQAEPLSITSSISSTINSIRISLEKQRSAGFHELSRFDKKILNSSGSASNLKRVGIILTRLDHEFRDSKLTIKNSLDEMGKLKIALDTTERDFSDDLINKYEFRIKSLLGSFNVVDSSITGYLEVQNIYAMYQLQRKIFWLSIVVTVATIIGVAANWKDLKELWKVVLQYLI